MDRRAPQVVSGTATSTKHDVLSFGHRSTRSACLPAATNGTGCHTSGSPDGPATDFASTALWAVVVATVAAAAFMGGFLFYARRRKRMQTRNRIRALLWDVVHGVQDGTIEPVVLQRLVYGPDGLSGHLQPPELFEAALPVMKRSPKLAKEEDVKDTSTWFDIRPLSLTPPSVVLRSSQPAGNLIPREPLIQWPWRHPNSLASAPEQGYPQSASGNETSTKKGKKPFALYIERNVDAGVLIVMPCAPPLSNESRTPPLLINCPFELGSASLFFQDNVLDPAAPPTSRAADLPVSRVIDPLSSALARHTQRGGGLYYTRASHPLSSAGRNLTGNEVSETPHSRWVARRGLAGGTPAG